jgi:DnaJ-class molecular chaperone
MTSFYETLGVSPDDSHEEIERRYKTLSKFFDQATSEKSDPSMKLYFDDLTLAYKTLSNEQSRKDYDEYIS